ncbi:MAG: hypothetical protein M1836_000932 [Candelina mexicana]|nr:MAG: hypothetical protein M1836_000932 [Candelina mexicana]
MTSVTCSGTLDADVPASSTRRPRSHEIWACVDIVFMTMLRQPLARTAAFDISSKHAWTCCCTKGFFHTSGAHAYAARSPTVKRNERYDIYNRSKGLPTSPTRQEASDAEGLPPLELLQSAYKSGTLGISVDKAVQAILAFIKLGSRFSQTELQKLCSSMEQLPPSAKHSIDKDQGHKLKPHNLTLLAHVQLSSPSLREREVAKNLLLAACSLSDPEATFRLVSQAIKKQQLGHYELRTAMQSLERLANKKHPQALVLKGQIAMSRCQEAAALKFFEEATQSTTETPDNGYDVGGPREGWLALGRGLLKQRNYTKAEQAFRIAADMDDPVAYHYLANLPKTSRGDREVHLLKAASSGIMLAAHELGLLYAERAKKAPSVKRGDWLLRAHEWFCVSGSDKYIPSLLEKAVLLKANDQYEEGLEALKEAEKCESAPDYIQQIKEVQIEFFIGESSNRA